MGFVVRKIGRLFFFFFSLMQLESELAPFFFFSPSLLLGACLQGRLNGSELAQEAQDCSPAVDLIDNRPPVVVFAGARACACSLPGRDNGLLHHHLQHSPSPISNLTTRTHAEQSWPWRPFVVPTPMTELYDPISSSAVDAGQDPATHNHSRLESRSELLGNPVSTIRAQPPTHPPCIRRGACYLFTSRE